MATSDSSSNSPSASDSSANASSTSPQSLSQPKRRYSDDKSDDKQADEESPDQEHERHAKAADAAAQVDLQTYVARHSLKRDQLAAFSSYARSKHQGRRTVADWEALLSEFNQRTVL